jgi:GAF domain-containing protein
LIFSHPAQEKAVTPVTGKPGPDPLDASESRTNLIALVQSFAARAVIAIENTSLLNELRQRTTDLTESLEQQTAISAILRVISNSPSDVQPVLASVAEHAARICEAQIANIVVVENDVMRVAVRFGEVAPPVGEQIPLDRSTIAGRSTIDMQPIQVADLQQAGDEFALGRQYAAKIGYHTVLGVPLIREGRALGSIVIIRTEARPFVIGEGRKQRNMRFTFPMFWTTRNTASWKARRWVDIAPCSASH